MSSASKRAIALVAGGLLAFSSFTMFQESAYAAGLDGFDPNYLISDDAMYGDVAESMSVEDIQQVLNTQGASCVKGKDGSPCLKNARFTTQTYPVSNFCPNAFQGGQNQSAAEVIAGASRACRISPKVLIVLLQKEQGLVTSTNPTARNYARATGFACPDTAPCDPAKAGFATQVYAAASRLQQYKAEPHRFNFAVGRTSTIGYHPNASCGTTTVTPRTAATAALYNYTPYVPNAAALANPRGAGDSCSAYGNRNFFRIHSDWFGQPNKEEETTETPEPPAPDTPKPDDPAHNGEEPDNDETETELPLATADNLQILIQKQTEAPKSIRDAFPIGNWDGKALADVATVAPDGDLKLFPHHSPSAYNTEYRIGTGWTMMRSILGGADFDGDRKDDIVAVDKAHNMYLYRGLGNGGFGRADKIGTGWNIFDDLLLLPNGPGGKPVIAGTGAGGTYLYTTDGKGRWTGRQQGLLPSLKGAIAGSDFSGRGYSSIIIPESTENIAVYGSSDGLNYVKTATITVKPGYSRLLASGHTSGKGEYLLDFLDQSGRVISLTLRTSASTPPPAPSVPEIPKQSAVKDWAHVSFKGSNVVGTGWPPKNVFSMGDFNGDGHNDAAIMWNNGDLVLYPSYNMGSGFHSPMRIGTGWTIFSDIHTGTDFNGDGLSDVVARAKDGYLWLYPGNGFGGFSSRYLVGSGWNMFDTIHVLAQGHNGAPIVYGVQGERIRQYPTNGRGSFLRAGSWQDGYAWVKNAVAADDWDNDGYSDLLYRDNEGNLFVAPQSHNGFLNPLERRVGIGWQGYSGLVSAYMTGINKVLWVVSPDGKLHIYRWEAKNPGAFSAPPRGNRPPSGGQIVNRSYRDGAWLKHPIQWKGQPDDETCGPTSMWMVLNYLGAHRSAFDNKPLDVWTLKGKDYANVGTGYSGGTSWEEKRLSVGMNRWLGGNYYKQWTFPNGSEFRSKVIDSFATGRPVVVDTIENYGGPHYNGHVGQSSHIVVVNEYHTANGAVGFVDPGGPGSAISGYSAQRYFRYPSAVSFGNNFLGNYGGGGHGMVY